VQGLLEGSLFPAERRLAREFFLFDVLLEEDQTQAVQTVRVVAGVSREELILLDNILAHATLEE
jgi:hypothetical protein